MSGSVNALTLGTCRGQSDREITIPDLRRLQSPRTSECTPENGVCMAGYTGMVTSSCSGKLEGRTPLCCKVHSDELGMLVYLLRFPEYCKQCVPFAYLEHWSFTQRLSYIEKNNVVDCGGALGPAEDVQPIG